MSGQRTSGREAAVTWQDTAESARFVSHPRTDAAVGAGSTTGAHPRSRLARRWNRMRHQPPPAVVLSAADQLRALLLIAEEALAVVPESNRVISACGAAAMVPVSVGRTCGEQLNVVHRLRIRLETLEVDPEFAPITEHLLRLLAYHQWMVHQAIGMAFTARPADRAEALRARLEGGLGEPADDLLAIRAELRVWSAESP
jgi:hypothetical protein